MNLLAVRHKKYILLIFSLTIFPVWLDTSYEGKIKAYTKFNGGKCREYLGVECKTTLVQTQG